MPKICAPVPALGLVMMFQLSPHPGVGVDVMVGVRVAVGVRVGVPVRVGVRVRVLVGGVPARILRENISWE